MNPRYVIIVGAGSTLSDAANKPIKNRPPLDSGFFKDASRVGYNELKSVEDYLEDIYDFDPKSYPRDSLEAVMAIIYADIYNPKLADRALKTFLKLITLFNKRIADTTNSLKPTSRFRLYRIISKILDSGISPQEICIITFNQDIQIEKILSKLQKTNRATKNGRIFNFPYCYEIPDADELLSYPSGSSRGITLFKKGDSSDSGVCLLKLHGSLNWYSKHQTKSIPRNSILSQTKTFHITSRESILSGMTYTTNRNIKYHTFPLIIPPVTHKAGILHNKIYVLWEKAEYALKTAEEIMVFGYSCPQNDFESANLLRRTIRQNTNIRNFSVIDPNPEIFQRYVELTGLDSMHYYRGANIFISKQFIC